MPSKVFWIKTTDGEAADSIATKTAKLFDAAGLSAILAKGNLTALKLHFGEKGGPGHAPVAGVKAVVERVKAAGAKPFLTDTNTLYVGMRSNSVDHLTIAAEHGFSLENTGAPVVIGDGLRGESHITVKSSFKERDGVPQSFDAHLCGVARTCDAIIGISHVTGHLGTGFGSTLKNIGMGFASRGGKLAQHSAFKPEIQESKCVACGECVLWCPSKSISMADRAAGGKKFAVINQATCIGCGKCLAICRAAAIKVKWDSSAEALQKNVVKYCNAVLAPKRGKMAFINYATSITEHCDCIGKPYPNIAPDVGIFASLDPVAVDAASAEAVNKAVGKDIFKHYWPKIDYHVQFDYATEIGLGDAKYELVEV
jgi:uncharacterized Fe-S center protein